MGFLALDTIEQVVENLVVKGARCISILEWLSTECDTACLSLVIPGTKHTLGSEQEEHKLLKKHNMEQTACGFDNNDTAIYNFRPKRTHLPSTC